jgi:hypothetical protein
MTYWQFFHGFSGGLLLLLNMTIGFMSVFSHFIYFSFLGLINVVFINFFILALENKF